MHIFRVRFNWPFKVKVIYFGTSRKRIYDFVLVIETMDGPMILSCTVSEIRRLIG